MSKGYYTKNKKKVLEKARERALNRSQEEKEKRVVYLRQWHENNPDYKRKQLLKKYDLTIEQFDILFEQQGKKCAICHRPDPEHSKTWNVDHCHETGKIRGILCPRCNNMLGYAQDRIETLQEAIVYLKQFAK